MPIANISDQATASAAQLKLCPHPYIKCPERLWVCHTKVWHNPLPPPVINWGQTRQTEGRDVSMIIARQLEALLTEKQAICAQRKSLWADLSGYFLL
jgi:hypothetical protein